MSLRAGGSDGKTLRSVSLLSLLRLLAALAFLAAGGTALAAREPLTFYLSPTGRDGADGLSPAKPMRSFERAFSRMQAGDELVLLDGVYSAAAGTGTIHWNNGSSSAQIPSGTSARITVVRAQNPGSVTIQGPLFIGRSTRKDSYIRVQGITFEGGGALYNTSFITIKDSGFHGPFGIGTNDHDEGNTDNLIEDVWVWAAGQRIIAINYRAHRNVWRRVVVRGDGCGTAECSGSGNPNVGITIYDSSNVSFQNVMVLDRVLARGDSPYADFACAQHTPDARWYFGRNSWLGVLSLNAPDIGFYCEPDEGATLSPVLTIRDSVFWNARVGGVNIARSGSGHVIERVWIRAGGDGFRFAPELADSGARIEGLTINGRGRYALNTSVAATGAAISGEWQSATNQQGCSARCTLAAAVTTQDSAPIVVTNLIRYGVDGTRFAAPGYADPSPLSLWPWPNEERIRRDMCRDTRRGFCADGMTLSRYLIGESSSPGGRSTAPH